MKKCLLFLSLAISVMASAQVLNVKSQQQLAIPTGNVKVAGIAADGSYILLTTFANEGLTKYTLSTGETEIITSAPGAGYNATIAADGQTIVFREKVIGSDRNVQTALRSVRLGQAPVTLQQPTRSARQLAVASNLQAARPTVSIENGQLMLTIGANTTTLSPCGTDKSYIWPSVSPDGKRVLFYVCGVGAYVCDLSGHTLTFLGHDVRAPKWYNNTVVIGMNDQDNGEFTTSSEIVAVSLKGARQVLTSGINAMYPYPSNGHIVCSGLNGETYLLTVE